MPHVVLKGEIALEDVFSRVQPLFIRVETGILKTAGAYLSRDRNSILIEALAVETDSKRSFLAMIGRRDDGLVVRIYPGGGREDPWGEASARGAGEAAPACVPEAPGRGNESYRVPGIQLPLAAVCGEIALRIWDLPPRQLCRNLGAGNSRPMGSSSPQLAEKTWN